MSTKFPKTIMVYWYEDGKERWLTAVRSIDELPDDEPDMRVALYELLEVTKLRIDKYLQP